MADLQNTPNSRTLIYGSMVLMLAAIAVGGSRGAPPVYLAVGFLGEIILGATAHLSTMIEQNGLGQAEPRAHVRLGVHTAADAQAVSH